MATDPRWTAEEKKRREQRQRLNRAPPLNVPGEAVNVVRDQGVRGLGRALKEDFDERLENDFRMFDQAAGSVMYGRGGAPTAAQRAAEAAAPSNTPVDFSNVRGGSTKTRAADLGDTARTGLTRIYKTKDANGNSVYTNVGPKPAGAEERFYNLYGNRQTDFSQSGLDAAEASIGYAQRGTRERAAFDEERALEALGPEGQRAVMIAQMQQGGANERARQERGLRRELASAADQRYQRAADRADDAQAFNQDMQFRVASRTPEGRLALTQESINSLANLPPAERAAILAAPENQQGARTLEMGQQLLDSTGTGARLSQITKTGGLRRFFGGSEYDLNNGLLLDDTIDPTDLGLTKDQLDALILAQQTRSRNNNPR